MKSQIPGIRRCLLFRRAHWDSDWEMAYLMRPSIHAILRFLWVLLSTLRECRMLRVMSSDCSTLMPNASRSSSNTLISPSEVKQFPMTAYPLSFRFFLMKGKIFITSTQLSYERLFSTLRLKKINTSCLGNSVSSEQLTCWKPMPAALLWNLASFSAELWRAVTWRRPKFL